MHLRLISALFVLGTCLSQMNSAHAGQGSSIPAQKDSQFDYEEMRDHLKNVRKNYVERIQALADEYDFRKNLKRSEVQEIKNEKRKLVKELQNGISPLLSFFKESRPSYQYRNNIENQFRTLMATLTYNGFDQNSDEKEGWCWKVAKGTAIFLCFQSTFPFNLQHHLLQPTIGSVGPSQFGAPAPSNLGFSSSASMSHSCAGGSCSISF